MHGADAMYRLNNQRTHEAAQAAEHKAWTAKQMNHPNAEKLQAEAARLKAALN